jgi:Zn-dependent protease with chaperone function
MKDETTFTGGVFSEAIQGGRSGAEITLSPRGISACTAEGDNFVLSYSECRIEIGGFSGRMVFCRNHDKSLTIFCEDRSFPRELLQASSGLLDEQLSDQLKQRRSATWRGRGIGVTVLVGIVVLIVGAYLGIRAGARAAIRAVPVSVDKQIGSLAFDSMDLGGPEINDPVVVEAIQVMVDRLEPHAALDGMEFEVHVVDAQMVNAFALPGGTIVVFTGLIAKADSANQVAGVLGHEMAHATLRHGMQRIGQSLGLAAAVSLLLGDTQGLVAAGAELFQLASINSYSREQENAADAEGVRMLHAAGIDPAGFTAFFQTLKDEHGELPGVASWISTHPQHDDRIAAIEEQLASLPDREYILLEIDWEDVQQRVRQMGP